MKAVINYKISLLSLLLSSLTVIPIWEVNAEDSMPSGDGEDGLIDGEDNDHPYCNPCGFRRYVPESHYQEIVSIPTQGSYSCLLLETRAREGYVPAQYCRTFQAFAIPKCGCSLRTFSPTMSAQPTISPAPTVSPSLSNSPTISPSAFPTKQPSSQPSEQPSESPSSQPSSAPSESPSETPSETPSSQPSEAPSETPSEQPSSSPSEKPSRQPSEAPSSQPSEAPSSSPTKSPAPTSPSEAPSSAPTPVGFVAEPAAGDNDNSQTEGSDDFGFRFPGNGGGRNLLRRVRGGGV